MDNIIYFIGGLVFIFLFIALGKIVKLEKEVRKLNKIVNHLLKKKPK